MFYSQKSKKKVQLHDCLFLKAHVNYKKKEALNDECLILHYCTFNNNSDKLFRK